MFVNWRAWGLFAKIACKFIPESASKAEPQQFEVQLINVLSPLQYNCSEFICEPGYKKKPLIINGFIADSPFPKDIHRIKRKQIVMKNPVSDNHIPV